MEREQVMYGPRFTAAVALLYHVSVVNVVNNRKSSRPVVRKDASCQRNLLFLLLLPEAARAWAVRTTGEDVESLG